MKKKKRGRKKIKKEKNNKEITERGILKKNRLFIK